MSPSAMHLDRGVRCHHLDRGDEMHKCRDTSTLTTTRTCRITYLRPPDPQRRRPSRSSSMQAASTQLDIPTGDKRRKIGYGTTVVSPEDTPVNVPSLGVAPGRPSRANTYRGKASVDKLWTHILEHRSTLPEQRKRKTPADGKDRREAKSVPQCKWSHMSGHTQAASELPRHVHQSVT